MSGTDYTQTATYGLYKPTPNADGDAWGAHLNLNADTLDALILSTNNSLGNYLPISQSGVPNGVATLGPTGIVPTAQLPVTPGALTYLGGWNPSTNTPVLASGALAGGVRQANGCYYLATVSGTTAAIDGNTTWGAGDWVVSNGTTWQRAQVGTGAYLPLAGGTLGGPLTLSGNATLPMHAVPLQQLNSAVAGAGVGTFLPLTGGTVTGATTFSGAGTMLSVSNDSLFSTALANGIKLSGAGVTVTGAANTGLTLASTGTGRHRFTSANGQLADFRDGGAGPQVNFVTIASAATGGNPNVSVANSADANANLQFNAKGTGYLLFNSPIVSNSRNIVWSGSNAPNNTYLTLTGTMSGTVSGGDAAAAFLSISDTINNTSGLVHALNVQHTFGGSLSVGSKSGLNVFLAQTALTSSKGNISGQIEYAGAIIESRATTNDGGISNQGFGYVVGANVIARCTTGATYYGYLEGLEIDIQAAAGTAPFNKVGLKISASSGDGDHGSMTDAAIVLSAGGSNPAGFNTLIQFGQQDSNWPTPITGTLLGSQPVGIVTPGPKVINPQAALGIDWSLINFTTSAIRVPGFAVSGVGAAQIGAAVLSPTATGASLDVVLQQSSAPTPTVAGSGYFVGDILFHPSGAQSTVSSTSAGAGPGGVTGLTQLVAGYSASPPVGAQVLRGGSGVGVQATLTWTTPAGLSINPTGQHIGFNGTAPIARPTVTGAKGSNAALASLMTALAAYGLVTDSTSA